MKEKNDLSGYTQWVQVSKKALSILLPHLHPQNQVTVVIVLNLKDKDTIFKGTKKKIRIIFRVGRIQMNLDLFLRLQDKNIAWERNCYQAQRTGTLGPTWPGRARAKSPDVKTITESSENQEQITS